MLYIIIITIITIIIIIIIIIIMIISIIISSNHTSYYCSNYAWPRGPGGARRDRTRANIRCMCCVCAALIITISSISIIDSICYEYLTIVFAFLVFYISFISLRIHTRTYACTGPHAVLKFRVAGAPTQPLATWRSRCWLRRVATPYACKMA